MGVVAPGKKKTYHWKTAVIITRNLVYVVDFFDTFRLLTLAFDNIKLLRPQASTY